MEFAFTEEQLMIRDTADAFLAEKSTSEAIRSAMISERGYYDALWQEICQQMYWQAVTLPEAVGGLGLGQVELIAMLEQMGRYLLCAPFYSTVCLGANALLVAGNSEQQERVLSRIVAGETATLAFTGSVAGQQGGIWDASAITALYEKSGDHYVIDGSFRYVVDGASADILVVAARSKGSSGEHGIQLFVVDSNTPGVERLALPTMDQTRKQAELVFNSVVVDAANLLVGEHQGWDALGMILDLATIALAAEQMGGAQRVLDMAVDYTKERVQFNRSIASFQAIKHKAADMMLRVEVARSAVYYAACAAQDALDKPGPEARQALTEAASIAKAYCSDAYFRNAGECLQMHGGVGFTWEYDVHLFFKRAKASEHFLGNGAWHRERIARLLLDTEVAS